jgi:outer membrane immunogenic protein
MAAKAPMRALAPVAYAPSWSGCYIGAGGGSAMTNRDSNPFVTATGVAIDNNITLGARGWFGTVQGGCDYQFGNFVVGAFADYDFMDVHGDAGDFGFSGRQKMDQQWAVGGRLGYVVFPQLMTYVSGGFTEARFKSTDFTAFQAVTPSVTSPGFTKGGWFIGLGDEYALNFLPGLFWKTEYRYSEFDRANVAVNFFGTGIATGFSETSKVREHSVRSELVYRFNWGGAPIAARY